MKRETGDINEVLDGFELLRILDQDPKTKSVNLLGQFYVNGTLSNWEQAILILEKTHFSEQLLKRFDSQLNQVWVDDERNSKQIRLSNERKLHEKVHKRAVFAALSDLGQNDVYTWLLGWLNKTSDASITGNEADVKMTLIRPATQAHIDKYSAQRKVMVYETPEMYAEKVVPWIESFPPSRIQWVYNILEHKKEADSILFEDPDPTTGFIIVPDLKWDQKTMSSLYVQAIVHNRKIRSLRDLTREHIRLLESIKKEASRVVFEKYGLTGKNEGEAEGNVRCFLHYHPSY